MTTSGGYGVRHKDDGLLCPLVSLRKAAKCFALAIIIKGLYIAVAP